MPEEVDVRLIVRQELARERRRWAGALLAAAIVVPTALSAATQVSHTFTNGTLANAEEVNQNFSDLASAIDNRVVVETAEWTVGTETGTGTTFGPLPTAMTLDIETAGPATIVVDALISRVQHESSSSPTFFRVLLDGNEIGATGLGHTNSWSFQPMNLTAAGTVAAAGTHTVEVQYRLAGGRVNFHNDGNGGGRRRLTAMAVTD
jgi:hypothetical protein